MKIKVLNTVIPAVSNNKICEVVMNGNNYHVKLDTVKGIKVIISAEIWIRKPITGERLYLISRSGDFAINYNGQEYPVRIMPE
jgi:hypothetical protein